MRGDPVPDGEREEYDLLLQLEELESLKEEMEELGVRTLDEIEARMADLGRKLDQFEKGTEHRE